MGGCVWGSGGEAPSRRRLLEVFGDYWGLLGLLEPPTAAGTESGAELPALENFAFFFQN